MAFSIIIHWAFTCLAIGAALVEAASLECKTESLPNPIAHEYPDKATGTVNGTVAVLPIPYAVARQVVPSEYRILRDAAAVIFPDLAKEDLYPAMLQTELDHDVQAEGISIPDFSRASISFPFVDRLGDGYTSMAYGNHILLSALNTEAIAGTEAYGNTVTGATFHPQCDAYQCASNGEDGCQTTSFAAFSALDALGSPKISHNFTACNGAPRYSIDVYKNITNQPQFSNDKLVCDNYIRLFNASVTEAPYEPVFVQGTVSAVKPFFAHTRTWTDVAGVQMDNAFIENNYVKCDSLQGYTFSD